MATGNDLLGIYIYISVNCGKARFVRRDSAPISHFVQKSMAVTIPFSYLLPSWYAMFSPITHKYTFRAISNKCHLLTITTAD